MNRPLYSPLTSQAISLALVLVLALALAFALAFGLEIAAPALAQQQAQSSPAQPAPRKEKPENKKPKKVWTNDSLEDLGSTSGVSVVGGPSAARGGEKSATKAAGYAKEKDPTGIARSLRRCALSSTDSTKRSPRRASSSTAVTPPRAS